MKRAALSVGIFVSPPILQMDPEALCCRVVRPSVRA